MIAAKVAAQEKQERARLLAKEQAEAKAQAAAEARRQLAEKLAAEKAAEQQALEEKAVAEVSAKLARAEARAAKRPGGWPEPKAPPKPKDFVRPERALDAEIRRLSRKCNEALQNGDTHTAQEIIASLSQHLPEESLTLLRLRAWFAMSTGDDEAARDFYRDILARLATDLNSAVNLAVLEARAGREDEARRIIRDISSRLPDSDRLRAVRQAFGLSRDAR